MQNNECLLEIPYGMRDFLPHEAAEKRAIESGLAARFARWGYDEVSTPTIEYLETLTMGNGRALEPHMFKFFDRDNRTLALRHEMTTPIARVVASRLKDSALPLKLSYVSSVFRYEQAQTGRQCEFNQAGVELVGSQSTAADAEVIALAVESMRGSGLKDFQVCLGQVAYIQAIMDAVELSEEQKEKITVALERHDLVGLERMVETSSLPQEAKDVLESIPLLHGGSDVLERARRMAMTEESLRALENLEEIYRILDGYGAAAYVTFDLGVIRDFYYYTGMVFEAYTPGLGFPLCGGGRYDRMLSDFGSDFPATGFALGIERLMLALDRQGRKAHEAKEGVYVAYRDEGNIQEAIRKAQELRADGAVAELALRAQEEEEAEEYRKEKGYGRLLYLR